EQARDRLAERVSAALRLNACVVLQLGLPPGSARTLAQQFTEELTDVAARVVRHGATRRVYAEGGATATSLSRRLACRRMMVVRELAPGVVTLRSGGGQNCFLTIKPGSYSWPEAVRHSTVYGT